MVQYVSGHVKLRRKEMYEILYTTVFNGKYYYGFQIKIDGERVWEQGGVLPDKYPREESLLIAINYLIDNYGYNEVLKISSDVHPDLKVDNLYTREINSLVSSFPSYKFRNLQAKYNSKAIEMATF